MVRCARGELIEPGTPWDLGHVDGTDRKVYSGPEHRRCNRQTAIHRLRKVSRGGTGNPGLILGFRRARVRDNTARGRTGSGGLGETTGRPLRLRRGSGPTSFLSTRLLARGGCCRLRPNRPRTPSTLREKKPIPRE